MKRKRRKPVRTTGAQDDKELADFLGWAADQGWTVKKPQDPKDTPLFTHADGRTSSHEPLLVEYSIACAKGYKPVNKEFLRLAAGDVARRFPDNWGFILIAAPVGEGGRTTYTANVDRGDAIKLLRELLFRFGEAEEWMKHVK